MSRQDKATTEMNARTLREMLKRPENKFCADCKRNDPRWASWNLGVFLCIRCSGIHRSMGTHISRVKSVDLDVWTPEQMANIQKWGNRLANLYWEAHLKPGHIPPEHKMESFIRSKYESRRWARDGPPPSDPSVLDDGSAPQPAATQTPTAESAPRQTHAPSGSVSSIRGQPVTNRQPQPHHQLLSTSVANRTAQPTVAAAQPQVQQPPAQPAPLPVQPAPANDLFTLDFHNPQPPANTTPQLKKDVKQDILSLFSTPAQTAVQQQVPGFAGAQAGFGQFTAAIPTQMQAQQNVWGGGFAATAPQQQQQPAQTSFMGNAGVGMWGANSGWNAGVQVQPQSNLWGASQPAQVPHQQQQPQGGGMFNTNDIWASSGTTNTAGGGVDLFGSSTASTTQKKDDAFGDIWGGFK